MATQYDTLFAINFQHDYFGEEGYGGFTVSLPAETSNNLLRMGLIFKTQPGGLLIVYDTQFAGSPRSRDEALKTPLRLVFNLANNEPNFYIYTGGLEGEASENISRSLFCFTNETADGKGFRASLQGADLVSARELVTVDEYPEKFFSKPFGQICIQLHPALETAFTIHFGAKATHWRYLLVSPHLKELVSPAVVNKETGEAFIGPENISLPGNANAIAFRSVNPVKLTARPNKSFQLVENFEAETGRYRVVKGILPNPIASAITSIPSDEPGKLNFSEIFL